MGAVVHVHTSGRDYEVEFVTFEGRTVAVPGHIKDGMVRKASRRSEGGAPSADGAAYEYAHTEGVRSALLGMIGTQDYLGVNRRYYEPTEFGFEKQLMERLLEARRVRGTSAPAE